VALGGVTVAVRVTAWPNVDGLPDVLSEILVGARAPQSRAGIERTGRTQRNWRNKFDFMNAGAPVAPLQT
jgi:hypothetical protein